MMRAAHTLITDRLVLRLPQADDLSAYTDYCASDRSKFVRGPFSAAAAFDKFAGIIGHWALRGYGRYVITENDTAIGHVGPHHSDDLSQPEFTWTLWSGPHEGRGLMTEAVLKVKDHLLNDLGMGSLLVRVLPNNIKSVAMAERIGAMRTDLPSPDWYPGCMTYFIARGAAA